ncbi:AtpZ/AtpI family protein [Leptospira sp. 96542]|nr:AtpZ/AtpI family protein [Leptospira sp. 96542]
MQISLDPKKKEPSPMAMAGLGFEFVLSIGLFVLGGYYLDEYLATSPLWLLVGFFLGFGYSFYILIRNAQKNSD